MKVNIKFFIRCKGDLFYGFIYYLIKCLFFILMINSATAQLITETIWENTIGGSQKDYLTAIVATDDSGFVLAGYSNSFIATDKSENCINFGAGFTYAYWVVKIDSLGNIVWDNTIGGWEDDRVTCMTNTNDGGFIVGGYSLSDSGYDKSEDLIGVRDFWVVKLDSIGSIVWENTYGGTGDDQMYAIEPTSDGGFILGGVSDSPAGYDKDKNPKGGTYPDFWILKIDSSGTKLWDKTIGGNRLDKLNAIVADPFGGYLLGGYSESNASFDKSEDRHDTIPDGIVFYDYWIVKVDNNGNVVWDQTIGGSSDDMVNSIINLPDHQFLLTGNSSSVNDFDKTGLLHGSNDYWLVKIDSVGNIIWDKVLGGNDYENVVCSILTDSNIIITAGYSTSPIGFDKSEDNKDPMNLTADYWIVALDTGGNQIWDDVLGCEEEERIASIISLENNDLIIAGYSESDSCNDKSENSKGVYNYPDYWAVKMNDYTSFQIIDSAEICFNDYYILPWDDSVFTAGIYYDTIYGDYIDTFYTFFLVESTINDSVIEFYNYLEAFDHDADLYEWFDCNTGEIFFTEGFEFFTPYDGMFGVIIHKNECVDTSDCYFAYSYYSIENVSEPYHFTISPNPANELISIDAPFLFSKIDIYTITGQNILSSNFGPCSHMDIDIEGFSDGVFIIIIESGDRIMENVLIRNY